MYIIYIFILKDFLLEHINTIHFTQAAHICPFQQNRNVIEYSAAAFLIIESYPFTARLETNIPKIETP